MTSWHADDLGPDFDAEFDAEFDALHGDGLSDLAGHAGDGAVFGTAEFYDEATLNAGPTAPSSAGSDRIDALVSGATGVQFAALVAFTQPLLERYGFAQHEAYDLAAAPEDADDTVVTLLETARLLWAFFSLDRAGRDAQRTTLLTHCYGPDADAEAWEDFADLLSVMEDAWESMSAATREDAEATDAATLSFDTLIDTTADSAFDPGRECDARALFALPLLDDPAVQADPTRFEAALHRADAYWTLAQQTDRADRLAALLPTLASSPAELPALHAEAQQMLARYDDLFND